VPSDNPISSPPLQINLSIHAILECR